MTLRPKKTVQKVLISTTSHFVGEYERNGLLITHAWPDFYQRPSFVRWSEGPASRSAFIIAFETEAAENSSGYFPEFSLVGELICGYLAVLFGKRFDNHGLVEGQGLFHIPDLTQFGHLCDHFLPQNSHSPRNDFPVPLNLAEISRMERLFLDNMPDSRFVKTFRGAAKYYLQSIRNGERDPEVAYLHLITVGEILSNFFKYEKHQLLDDDTAQTIAKIREGLPDGEQAATFILKKLSHVKQRFVKTIIRLVDPEFFQRSEARETIGTLREEDFTRSISAAYDLRSRYVHTGVSFGDWVSGRLGGMNNEVQLGRPVVEDKTLGNILAKAPTYIGLERIMRYGLLRFAQMNGTYDEPSDKPAANG